MRIIWLIVILIFGGPAWADPGDEYTLSGEGQAVLFEPLTQRQASPSEMLRVPNGFQSKVFAYGLGSIGDITLAENGSVYVTDPRANRVYEIADRGLDGRRDFQRPLITDLDHPTGVAIAGDSLFVADRRAVWTIDTKTGARRLLASLTNAPSEPHRPLLWHEPTGRVWIALTRSATESQVIAIDAVSGQAALIAVIPGAVSDITMAGGGTVWASAGQNLFALAQGNAAQPVGRAESNVQISGFVLVGSAPASGLEAWRDQVIISQSGGARLPKPGSGAMNLIAVPTDFGRMTGRAKIFADGFLDQSRRSAWGDPGPIALDRRGLFVADRNNGTIWRVYAKPAEPAPKADVEIIAQDAEEIVETVDVQNEEISSAPPLVHGSRIERGSSLEVGSTILKAWEEEKARKAAEEAETEPEPEPEP